MCGLRSRMQNHTATYCSKVLLHFYLRFSLQKLLIALRHDTFGLQVGFGESKTIFLLYHRRHSKTFYYYQAELERGDLHEPALVQGSQVPLVKLF